MTSNQLFVDLLKQNLEMTKGTLADFSDADFLVRPVPGANHTAWQLGHLINSETRMINGVKPGAGHVLPAGFGERFTKETAARDDATFFPKKDELLDLFTKARQATIRWAESLTPDDYPKPGPESIRAFAPTVGHVVAIIPSHVAMHIGQFQVVRRKLGKPILM